MTETHEVLRGELERLFEMDELTSLSRELLGYEPDTIGSATGKGAFARALVTKCDADHALLALTDAMRFLGKAPKLESSIRPASSLDLKPGVTVGPYKISKKLAAGGLGDVYLAETDAGDDRSRVALKVISGPLSKDASAVARFLTGQRAIKRAAVAGVGKILDCGQLADGRPWVATEFVDGQTLSARVSRVGPMHINEARGIMKDLLNALDGLHARGLVHADVKSGNTFIVRHNVSEGKTELRGLLVDPGAHRLLSSGAASPDALGALRVFGNAHAVAPEVAKGEAVGASSDIYAAGVLFFELLTGKLPFDGGSAFEVIAKHLSAEPATPSLVAPKGWVQKELDNIVLKALAKEPKDRYASAREFLDSIEEFVRSKAGKAPIDEKAFADALKRLEKNPADVKAATDIEEVAAPAHAWERALEAYAKVAESAKDIDAKKALHLRAARIAASELRSRPLAESSYRKVLELDAAEARAHSGLEELAREHRDFEALSELLLERMETVTDAVTRAALLSEIGSIYEEKLHDNDNALVAYVQAIGETPSDERLQRAVERVAGRDADKWTSAVTELNELTQAMGDDPKAANAYVVLGRWYADRVHRPDFALPCYTKALSLDAASDAAYEGALSLYEKSQSWPEAISLLETRASLCPNPARARDYRARAATKVLQRLGDESRGANMLRAVLDEDPTHPEALRAFEQVLRSRGQWAELAEALERSAKQQTGATKVSAHLEVAALYEERLRDTNKAVAHFEAALTEDPDAMDALGGLERLFGAQGDFGKLLDVLERTLSHTATSRQRTQVLMKMGAILEERMQDPAKAIEKFEAAAALEPNNEEANLALARLYKRENRTADYVETLVRHAAAATDNVRKADLTLRAAHAMAQDLGAPERALVLAEDALRLDPNDNETLGLVARLKAQAGDASAAVEAVDRLIASTTDASKKANHLVEAARLLELAGDRDRAIERLKSALDTDENHADAAQELRRLYTARGDHHGAAALLMREVERVEGRSKRAALLAELGALQAEKLDEPSDAERSFERALELDPTCTPASKGIGDLAFARKDMAVAAKAYEPLLSRTSELDKATAFEISVRCGECFAALQQWSKAQRAYFNARGYAPDDLKVLVRLADVTAAAKEWDEAAELYRTVLGRSRELAPADKVHCLVGRGEALVQANSELPEAKLALEEAIELEPRNGAAHSALRSVYRSQKSWEKVVSSLRRQMEFVDEGERFDLLVQTGDVLSNDMKDRDKAAKSYVAALELNPDDRNLLTKLMAVYSESKDWQNLVDVIVRLADLVDVPAQKAKYDVTAASILHREMKDAERASDFYRRALELDPTLDKAFAGLVATLTQTKKHSELAALYRAQLDRVSDAEQQIGLWDALAEVYEHQIGDEAKAAEAYEAAMLLDPSGRDRLEKLATLYESDPKKFFSKGVEVHGALLDRSAYRMESYQALLSLYQGAKRHDEAFCVAQGLSVLAMARPEDESFFKKYRSRQPAQAKTFFDEELWQRCILHSDQDARITAIFAHLEPAMAARRGVKLESYGIDANAALDKAADGFPMLNAMRDISEVSRIAMPGLYELAKDPTGLNFVFSFPVAIGLGQAAKMAAPPQALAFVAGRHLSYFRPGHLARQLEATPSGLRAWLVAAIRLASPQFPVVDTMKAAVEANLAAIRQVVDAAGQAELKSAVSKLLAAGPELDLRRFTSAVDFTADRVGFIFSDNLELTVALIKASADEASVQQERLREIHRYAVSSSYMDLRGRLGIHIDMG